ncbi:hypothetical protein IHE45_17G103500 [Dioscorea alata]|uniref:Uncharacterized protein n=1 Tax=Dioscorea alata TaxID=55571 RepID=A0ACB7UEM2_DIOAL|nr:hypothetical protein IHE45_17G103500 [Dioscorea alata]
MAAEKWLFPILSIASLYLLLLLSAMSCLIASLPSYPPLPTSALDPTTPPPCLLPFWLPRRCSAPSPPPLRQLPPSSADSQHHVHLLVIYHLATTFFTDLQTPPPPPPIALILAALSSLRSLLSFGDVDLVGRGDAMVLATTRHPASVMLRCLGYSIFDPRERGFRSFLEFRNSPPVISSARSSAPGSLAQHSQLLGVPPLVISSSRSSALLLLLLSSIRSFLEFLHWRCHPRGAQLFCFSCSAGFFWFSCSAFAASWSSSTGDLILEELSSSASLAHQGSSGSLAQHSQLLGVPPLVISSSRSSAGFFWFSCSAFAASWSSSTVDLILEELSSSASLAQQGYSGSLAQHLQLLGVPPLVILSSRSSAAFAASWSSSTGDLILEELSRVLLVLLLSIRSFLEFLYW